MSAQLSLESTQTQILRIRNGVVGSNTFVVRLKVDAPSGNRSICVIVDPGSSVEALDRVIREISETPITLITHGHFDHVLGAHRMAEIGSPIYMNGADVLHLRRNNFYLRALSFRERVKDFDFIDLRTESPQVPGLEVVSAPGHSAGSSVFHVNGLIFTGDTVLERSVFSPTVSGSDIQSQYSSVVRIAALCAASRLVLPGHGKPLTFEQLIDRNAEFRQITRSLQDLK